MATISPSATTKMRTDDEAPPAPPANVEAEQALLGGILINNAAHGRVASFLAPEHFHTEVHGRIYAAMGALIGAGAVADPISLKNQFDQDGALVSIGGAKYLARLAEAAVTIINAEHYGRAIYDAFLRRELITIGQAIVADAFSYDLSDAAEKQLGRAEEQLGKIADRLLLTDSGPRPFAAVATESLERTEASYKARAQGATALPGVITVGLTDLDKATGGSLPGDLVIVGGRPSMGKSSFASNTAVYAARQGHPGAIFTLEETGIEIAHRIIGQAAGVSPANQRRGELSARDFDALLAAAERLSDLPLFVDETSGLSVADIRLRARQLKRRYKIEFVVVDHLKLVGFVAENRRIGLASVSRQLKALAKELNVVVYLLAQLSRRIEDRDVKRPTLSDLSETGDTEENADTVIFIHRPEYYLSRGAPERRPDEGDDKFNDRYDRWKERCEAAKGLAELVIAKNRFGTAPMVCTAYWDAEMTRFDNYVGPDFLPEQY